MKEHEEIVSLLQTLGAGFRLHPEKIGERLDVLSSGQQKELLHLLKLVAEGNLRVYSFGHFPRDREAKKGDTRVIWDKGPTPSGPMKAASLPEPDSYDAIDDRRAICRGCPSGCELQWDDQGNYTGYSCIVGQETAAMLADYYRRK